MAKKYNYSRQRVMPAKPIAPIKFKKRNNTKSNVATEWAFKQWNYDWLGGWKAYGR